MDSIVHFENDRYVGRTKFRHGLLNNMVVLGIKDVEGVASIGHEYFGQMAKVGREATRFLSCCYHQGVRVNFDFDGVSIDVKIRVLYGYSAADISYRVQESIMTVAGPLVDGKIKNVNVKISGVVHGGWSKKIS
jgi:uncharacterized alkaline shock family protein YloU